jgi:hypothetical protein
MAWAAWDMVTVAIKKPLIERYIREGLLESNLAHGFCAEDFANVEQ